MYIHKQNNPILYLYCAFPRWSTGSCFALQALGSPMDLDVRSARRLLHNILLYISGIVKPTYSWVYQTVHSSQYTIGFIRLQLIKPIHYWVYQATQPSQLIVGFIRLQVVKPTLYHFHNFHNIK